jgi:methyl-accepting chemotaxis protein
MNLDKAIAAHAEWKMKFRSAIARKEKLEVDKICLDNACPLGAWLHGEAKASFGKLASYARCVDKHAAFHREAGKVATAINAGKYAEAESMMANGTSYAAASGDVGASVIVFRKEAKL